jgi:serine protease AprX
LANNPKVAYISSDRPFQAMLDYTATAVDAPLAWQAGFDGTGVGIAIIDSGIFNHPDLKDASGNSRIVYSQDFVGDGSTNDPFGHGTHVAGIAAGNAASSTCSTCTRTLRGTAPGASLINRQCSD